MNIVFLYDIKMEKTVDDIIAAKRALIHETLLQIQHEIHKENINLEKKLRSANNEIDNLKNDNKSLKANLRLANAEIYKTNNSLEFLKYDFKLANETIDKIKKENQTLLEKLSNQNTDLESAIDNLKNDNKSLKSEIDSLKLMNQQLESELKSAKESDADIVLIENNEPAVNELTDNQHNESSFNERLAAIQNQLDELKKEYACQNIRSNYDLYEFLLANLNTPPLSYVNGFIWMIRHGLLIKIYCKDDKYICDQVEYNTQEEVLKVVKMLLA